MDTERKLQQQADELGDGAEDQTDTPEQRRRMRSDQEAAIHDCHPKRNCKIVGCVCWDDQSLSRRPCPTEGCKKFYDVLVQLNGHGTPQMHNVDISTMFHDPWQIAKYFLPPSGNATMASANDCDVFGLCSIIINCKHFGISFDSAEVFSQVEDISRDIMHSAVQEVTEQDMNLKLDTIVRALQCGQLNHDEDAKRAATEFMKMKNSTLSRQMETDVKQEWLKTHKESVENQLIAMENTEDETRKAIQMSVDERQEATVAFLAHPTIDKTQPAESKSSNKKTIFGKPFEQSCVLDGEKTTFQIPGSDVKVIFPNSLTKNNRIEVHGSSFRSIFHIRKRFDLSASEAVASPVTEYHVTGCTKCTDYTCVKMPFVGPKSELKVWKFLSDKGIKHTTTRLQVPLKGKDSNEHLFYEVEGASTCSVYTRSFSGFFCTTDGHRPLKLRALLYASHKRFQPLNQHEVRIRMYIADEVMKFQDYKQTMDDIEMLQDRLKKEDKVLSLLEDDLTEDSNIEVCVTPTEDSAKQWVHKLEDRSGQPIFAEIQTLPLRDIVQKCPDCPGCHIKSNELPYSVEWYLANRQDVIPSLRFKGLVTVDCVNNHQRRSTTLIIDELLLRSTDRLSGEEIDEGDRMRQLKGFVMKMGADDRQKLQKELFGLGPTVDKSSSEDEQLCGVMNSIGGVPDETGNYNGNKFGRKRPVNNTVSARTNPILPEVEPRIKKQKPTAGTRSSVQKHEKATSPCPRNMPAPADFAENDITFYATEIKPRAIAGIQSRVHSKEKATNPWARTISAKGTKGGQAQADTVPQLEPEQSVPSFYSMERKPRGLCVIINNKIFATKKKRRGTDKDAESLETLFGQIHLEFIVQRYDNLDDTEMNQKMKDVARINHSNFDCLVVCILTHGRRGNLTGVNGGRVSIKGITSHFTANKCRSLGGKPKVFFLQACQGTERMGGADIEEDGTGKNLCEGETETDLHTIDFIPDEADFLLGYSTVPGCVSYRSRTKGSWYIQSLCEQLHKLYKSHDLMTILTEVNRQVAEKEKKGEDRCKQMPAPFFTLRKRLQFI